MLIAFLWIATGIPNWEQGRSPCTLLIWQDCFVVVFAEVQHEIVKGSYAGIGPHAYSDVGEVVENHNAHSYEVYTAMLQHINFNPDHMPSMIAIGHLMNVFDTFQLPYTHILVQLISQDHSYEYTYGEAGAALRDSNVSILTAWSCIHPGVEWVRGELKPPPPPSSPLLTPPTPTTTTTTTTTTTNHHSEVGVKIDPQASI
jgi:hypothetical protein